MYSKKTDHKILIFKTLLFTERNLEYSGGVICIIWVKKKKKKRIKDEKQANQLESQQTKN